MSKQEFRNASPLDARRCFNLETLAYNGDEAATLDKISKRIAVYPEGFLILEVDSKIIGFINSGCAYNVEMSDDDFKGLVGHDPSAPNVVILSVVVDPEYQGKGMAKALMSEFVRRMAEADKATIHLMCKEHYVPLYEKLGYRYVQPSASVLFGVQWHEMMMNLTNS